MIVVSNTSPLMNLAVVGKLGLLRKLYGKVLIPDAVVRELSVLTSEQFNINSLSWLEMRAASNHSFVSSLLMTLDPAKQRLSLWESSLKPIFSFLTSDWAALLLHSSG